MKTMTINDLCLVLKLGRNKIYEEIASGRLRTYTVGRRRYSTDEAVEEYIRAREKEQQAAGAA